MDINFNNIKSFVSTKAQPVPKNVEQWNLGKLEEKQQYFYHS